MKYWKPLVSIKSSTYSLTYTSKFVYHLHPVNSAFNIWTKVTQEVYKCTGNDKESAWRLWFLSGHRKNNSICHSLVISLPSYCEWIQLSVERFESFYNSYNAQNLNHLFFQNKYTRNYTRHNRLKKLLAELLTFYYILQRWRRRWFVLQQGKLPRQYVLNYYADENKRRLKGSIPLDECEQVKNWS